MYQIRSPIAPVSLRARLLISRQTFFLTIKDNLAVELNKYIIILYSLHELK